MNIKLRARLSAYSKIDSLASINSYIPEPELSEAGHIVTVGAKGEYKLMGTTSQSDIDTLFDVPKNNIVSKDDIDSLFPVDLNKDDVVNKDQIDDLFNPTTPSEPPINSGRVTYDQIDSLFK